VGFSMMLYLGEEWLPQVSSFTSSLTLGFFLEASFLGSGYLGCNTSSSDIVLVATSPRILNSLPARDASSG
jgi:hypothetical protein